MLTPANCECFTVLWSNAQHIALQNMHVASQQQVAPVAFVYIWGAHMCTCMVHQLHQMFTKYSCYTLLQAHQAHLRTIYTGGVIAAHSASFVSASN